MTKGRQNAVTSQAHSSQIFKPTNEQLLINRFHRDLQNNSSLGRCMYYTLFRIQMTFHYIYIIFIHILNDLNRIIDIIFEI